ncbi:MAG: hypothetical protein K2Y22_15835 [Candidatus Obscuribacterales bacterium]|nr:hypothetical protein [Candidatus Obscuribacterales bacterium]
MNRHQEIIARIIQIVQLLGDLSDEFVFLGGSAVPMLITDEAAPDVRPTKDVDVVVQAVTRFQYHKIEERLAQVGFHLDMLDPVICRYKQGGLILDVMPTDEKVLSFGNRWYAMAAQAPIIYPLIPERKIKVINAPLFLCTKFDAYKTRGRQDEKDLEDIINVVDGRRQLFEELKAAPPEVRKFAAQSTLEQLSAGLTSRLDWFLPTDAAGAARRGLVVERLKAISVLE